MYHWMAQQSFVANSPCFVCSFCFRTDIKQYEYEYVIGTLTRHVTTVKTDNLRSAASGTARSVAESSSRVKKRFRQITGAEPCLSSTAGGADVGHRKDSCYRSSCAKLKAAPHQVAHSLDSIQSKTHSTHSNESKTI